jgi:hypothetical protein
MDKIMKSFVKIILSFFLLVSGSIYITNAQSGPYFGQSAPGTTPIRFAPTKIPLNAWGITFSPDGLECFITQTINNEAVIYTSKETNGTWPNLSVAPFSGEFWDMEPQITPDGNRMYFGSKRPLPGAPPNVLYQWYIDKTGSGWTEPQPMAAPLWGIFMMFPSVADNGNMYFTSGNGATTCWIAVSRYENGSYQEPEPVSDSINYLYWAAHPFIAPDESYIIFDACTDSINHIYDLFISFRKPDDNWTTAKKIPSPISPGGCPFVSRDGNYFFFWKTNCIKWVDAGFIEDMRPLYGEYLGRTPPGLIPERFAPPSLRANAEWFWHGSPSFSPDLTEMFFVKYIISENRTEMAYMKNVNGEWTAPQTPSFANLGYIENNPYFSPSGDTLYYYSQKPGGPYFYVTRQNDDWSESQQLFVPIGTENPSWQFSIALDRTFYFDKWVAESDINIFKSELVNGQYIEPEELGTEINSPYMDWGTWIDQEEEYMIFASNRPGGSGMHDLYLSLKTTGGTWSAACNLGNNINGSFEDGFPYITPDDEYFFYTTAKNDDVGYNPYWVKATAVLPQVGIGETEKNYLLPDVRQNFPNPATDQTTIEYCLLNKEHVVLKLFDTNGKQVTTILDDIQNSGIHTAIINTHNLESGVYFYQFLTSSTGLTKKFIVMK